MAGPPSGSGDPVRSLPGTDSGSEVPGPVFGPPGHANQRQRQGAGQDGQGPIFPDDGQSQPPINENAPGYVPAGQGVDERAPDGGPIRSKPVMEEHAARLTAGAGGFKLDPDAMRALLPRWKGVRDELWKLRRDAEVFIYLSAPAEDDASKKQIQTTYEHKRVYESIVKQQYEYAKAYVDALEHSIKKVEEADQSAGDAARAVGKDM